MQWLKPVRDLFYSLHNYRRASRLGSAEERNGSRTVFLLCGLYCVVAIVFLAVFGSAALLHDNAGYGHVLLGFAVFTAVLYISIWFSGRYYLANHLVTSLMGLLCLYLFYTGGEAGTGPLWYFVFPLIAMFLQGTLRGSISVMLLLVATVALAALQGLELLPGVYSEPFLQRMVAVYVTVSALSFLFAWFRDADERRLRESNRQLAVLSGYDELTGLASRRRAEIVLDVEARKAFRYQNRFCLALFRIDGLDRIREQNGVDAAAYVIQEVALLLKQDVRRVDMLARWDDRSFAVLYPATPLKGAVKHAERMRLRMTRQQFRLDGQPTRVTLSVGVGQFAGEHVSRFVHELREQLSFAEATGGNCVMFADVQADAPQAANGSS